jgi:hypothetical protein
MARLVAGFAAVGDKGERVQADVTVYGKLASWANQILVDASCLNQ